MEDVAGAHGNGAELVAVVELKGLGSPCEMAFPITGFAFYLGYISFGVVRVCVCIIFS